MGSKSEMILYKTPDGSVKLDVRMESETLWLTQAQIAQLYGRDISVISRHMSNIFTEGELDRESNLQNMQIPNSDRPVALYSLDAILAVGYRVKSPLGTQFRQWATQILHEYLQKGFSMNDEFLKNMSGGLYFELQSPPLLFLKNSKRPAQSNTKFPVYITSLRCPPLQALAKWRVYIINKRRAYLPLRLKRFY